MAFPGVSDRKESACSAGGPGSIPGLGRSPWRREWEPTPVFLPGEFHRQRSLVGYSPWGCKEVNTTERLTLCIYKFRLLQIQDFCTLNKPHSYFFSTSHPSSLEKEPSEMILRTACDESTVYLSPPRWGLWWQCYPSPHPWSRVGCHCPPDVTHIGDRVADTLTPAPLLKASEGNS